MGMYYSSDFLRRKKPPHDGDAAFAEALLVARYIDADGKSYPRLVPLAEALEGQHCPLGATACYRVLLLGILTRA
jgi:hypothetical protein